MAQAIQVKYLPPTNYKGARFSVRTQAKTKIYNEPINAFGVEQNALVIATRFAREMGWTGVYYGGTLKNGDNVFVQAVDWCKYNVD